MLLEMRTISRKTPTDGKLEISEATAQRLALFGAEVPVAVAQSRGAGVVSSMPCGCGKAGAAHVHHFLQSDLFRALVPEMRVRVDLDEADGTVRIHEHV